MKWSVEDRLVVQYAAQLVAAVGQSLGEEAPDDSQQSLSLDRGPLDWLGATIAGRNRRAGLEPVRLELRLCDGAGKPLATFPLAGRTLADGLAFLTAEFGAPVELPKHPADFPHHALADGAPFPARGSEELVRLFADTHAILGELARPAPRRLWPHHFDLACSLKLGAVSLGMGVSPGDGATGLPYWYATPLPKLVRLAPLAGGGTWHTEGWFGAELPFSRFTDAGQLRAFFQSAITASRGA